MTAEAARPGRTRVDLPAVPALAGLYARALAGAARRVALSRVGRLGQLATALPEVEHVTSGVAADPDRLTAFQHLVGETASDALPAGYVHVLAFPVATALLVRGDFPLPAVGLVHVANRVVQERTLRLGERLEVRAHAERLRPHRRGTQVDLVTEVRAAGDDAMVWHEVSTYLATGVRLPPRPGDADAGTTPRAAFDPPVPTGRWTLGADEGRRYAAVSGDRNPLHLSALIARALGFPRAIAHGMDTASRGLAAVGPARGERFTWTVRFASPVLLPGTVTVRVAARGDGPGFTYTGWDARTGALHLTGTVVPR